MRKIKGCHFYINIMNLNEVVLTEESTTGKVNHSIHALDTFFSSIESYGKKKYPGIFTVEKITGSRLHMYVVADELEAFSVVRNVSVYAYELTLYMNRNVSKYKSLLDFKIQIGCCYGRFYDFIFKNKEYEEETTIGFAANYAAKLQNFTSDGCISISSNIYELLDEEQKDYFAEKRDARTEKYNQDCYYTTRLVNLNADNDITNDLEHAKEIANRVNLTDMIFRSTNSKVSFEYLSKKECKKIEGIPLFADVRDFTQKFEDDDSNLEEMAELTQSILTSMYEIVSKKGVHVQFQGDREFALYNNYNDYDCCTDAVTDGMRIIDAIKSYKVCVGVGQAIGNMFISKIGARGEKDNLVLGKTVTDAEIHEDEYADKNQLVIDKEIYHILKNKNKNLANQFHKLNENCYVTTVGYEKYLESVAFSQLEMNNRNNNYNGAWSK